MTRCILMDYPCLSYSDIIPRLCKLTRLRFPKNDSDLSHSGLILVLISLPNAAPLADSRPVLTPDLLPRSTGPVTAGA